MQLEDTAPWALAVFEAYLRDDVEGMRQAMLDDEFMENAANDWQATQEARDREGPGVWPPAEPNH